MEVFLGSFAVAFRLRFFDDGVEDLVASEVVGEVGWHLDLMSGS